VRALRWQGNGLRARLPDCRSRLLPQSTGGGLGQHCTAHCASKATRVHPKKSSARCGHPPAARCAPVVPASGCLRFCPVRRERARQRHDAFPEMRLHFHVRSFRKIAMNNFYHRLLAASCVIALAIFAPASALAAAPEEAAKAAEVSKVRYVVMLGSHDFEGLAAAEKAIIENYRAGRINTDEFSFQIAALVSPPSTSYIPDAELWVKAQPKSYAARLGLGILYMHAAWEARGNKFIRETSREQLDKMRELARKALDHLQTSLTLFEKPYPSYMNMIDADNLLSKGKKRHYLDLAIKMDPAARSVYWNYFIVGTPSWGGSFEELESLVAEAKQGPMPPHNVAILETNLLYLKGQDEAGLRRNPTGAASLFLQAYERTPTKKEDVWLLYMAATELVKAKQEERAIEVYTRIIEVRPDEDNAYAQRAWLYGGMQKHDLALKDYVASAKLGNRVAQNNAGYYYMVGRGGAKDLNLAKHYFTQSAAQGFEHAKEKLKVLEEMLAKEAKQP
jgi:tetratricopeptide (TPR) repeat protein